MSATPIPTSQGAQNNSLALQVVAYAARYLGVPYVWGGTSPHGFDCSGLVQYVYKHFGVSLPRTSEEQAKIGLTVPRGQIQPGDILFYNTTGVDSHEALYVGNNTQIVARHTGLPVMYQKVGNFTHAQRVLGTSNAGGGLTLGTPPGASVVPASNPLNPQDWFKAIADSLGVPDLKDAMQRVGLIVMGGGLVLLGIHILAGLKAPPKVPKDVTTNAANNERPQNQTSNAEGVRGKEGNQSVLRMGEQTPAASAAEG